ncbi:MAG: hypothetical protein KDB18_03780, partial [Salinibacterium sp.]|nr:hypothetical protein [Salinibacterium sp.]
MRSRTSIGVRGLVLAAGLCLGAQTAWSQSIWQPQNNWNVPAMEFTVMSPAGANINRTGSRQALGTQMIPTGGRTGSALVVNGTGAALENGDAILDQVQVGFGQYTHSFLLSNTGGAMADVVVPVLADANLVWAGPANNQARFKLQVDVQLFRQDPRPNPAAPLPGTYTAVGAMTTLDTGWFNDPGGARNSMINQTWLQRYANQPTGERGYQIRTTIRSIAQADSAGVFGAVGSGIGYSFASPDQTTSRGVTISVNAEPANYANANSRNEVAASWASQRYNVTGQGVNVGIIEPGKATNHASFGA